MIVIGIDPGATGAIATITMNPGQAPSLSVRDIPCLDRGVDVPRLTDLAPALAPAGTHCWLEANTGRQHDMPDKAFRFGLNTGQIHAAMTCLGFEVHWISPATWCGRFGLRGKTDDTDCRERAEKLCTIYPQARPWIYGKRDGVASGPVDALWIAYYGLVSLRGGEIPKVLARWAPKPARGMDNLDDFEAPPRARRTTPEELERKDTTLA